MAFLRVVQGGRPGELHELILDRLVLGRHPSCEVVLDNAVISRQHARLVRQGNSYVIEDLGSRNGTYVNGKAVSGLQPIRDQDRIRICDFVLQYLEKLPLIDANISEDLTYESRSPGNPRSPKTIEEDVYNPELESSSSIISTLNAGSRAYRLDVRPEIKLRAILELSSLFSRTIDLSTVLNKTLECLFRLFPQTDQGMIFLCHPISRKPILKAVRNQHGEASVTNTAASMTVIERALQTQEAILSEDMADDTRFRDSASASALSIRSMMCAPMTGSEEKSFGAIQLTTQNLKKVFTQDDLDLLISVAAQAGLAVENANLHAEMVLRMEMERELEVATQIQLGFLPNRKPRFPGYDFCHYYQAAQQVGGDYFDYVRLPDGRLAIAMGDVSGKGVPAALLMARLCSAVRYHLVAQPTVGQAMTELNRELLESSLGFRFITLVIAVLEPGSSDVTVVNAGHLPPLLHDDVQSYYLDGSYSGLPLGIGGDAEYQEQEIKLSPGACLLFYTDGITETADNREVLYGRERLLIARPEKHYSTEQLVNYVLSDVMSFARDMPQRDDRCIVALRYLPTEDSSGSSPQSPLRPAT